MGTSTGRGHTGSALNIGIAAAMLIGAAPVSATQVLVFDPANASVAWKSSDGNRAGLLSAELREAPTDVCLLPNGRRFVVDRRDDGLVHLQERDGVQIATLTLDPGFRLLNWGPALEANSCAVLLASRFTAAPVRYGIVRLDDATSSLVFDQFAADPSYVGLVPALTSPISTDILQFETDALACQITGRPAAWVFIVRRDGTFINVGFPYSPMTEAPALTQAPGGRFLLTPRLSTGLKHLSLIDGAGAEVLGVPTSALPNFPLRPLASAWVGDDLYLLDRAALYRLPGFPDGLTLESIVTFTQGGEDALRTDLSSATQVIGADDGTLRLYDPVHQGIVSVDPATGSVSQALALLDMGGGERIGILDDMLRDSQGDLFLLTGTEEFPRILEVIPSTGYRKLTARLPSVSWEPYFFRAPSGFVMFQPAPSDTDSSDASRFLVSHLVIPQPGGDALVAQAERIATDGVVLDWAADPVAGGHFLFAGRGVRQVWQVSGAGAFTQLWAADPGVSGAGQRVSRITSTPAGKILLLDLAEPPAIRELLTDPTPALGAPVPLQLGSPEEDRATFRRVSGMVAVSEDEVYFTFVGDDQVYAAPLSTGVLSSIGSGVPPEVAAFEELGPASGPALRLVRAEGLQLPSGSAGSWTLYE